LMSDVMPDWGASLLDLFNSWDNKQDDKIEILWEWIWEIHRSLSDLNIDDTRLDWARLKSRIKQIFSGTKLFSSWTYDAGIATHQYVLWDLSPKNIWFKKIWKRFSPVFFDFEFFDLWSTSFEVAFFCAHIYLHFSHINGLKYVELFLLTYKWVVSDFKTDNLFWIMFHWVIRYRVWIKPLKYPINIHDERWDRLLHESEDFLKTMAII
jgi:hypothetical protein